MGLFYSALLLSTLFVSGCKSSAATVQAGSKTTLVSDDEAKAIGQKLFDLATTKCGSEYIWSLDSYHSRFTTYKLVVQPEAINSREKTFEGTRWTGMVTVQMFVLNAEGKEVRESHSGEEMLLTNRGGHWYYTKDDQFEHGLIPIEGMQGVRDSCDSKPGS
jgi:hypothetical protein